MSKVGGIGNNVSYTGGKTPQMKAVDDAERQNRIKLEQLEHIAKAREAETEERVAETHRQGEISENKERSRHEASIEAQRSAFFAQTRELQQRFQAELARIRREGESEVHKLNDYYRNTLNTIEHDGSKALEGEIKQTQAQLKFTRDQGQHEVGTLQEQYEKQLAQLHDNRERQSATLTEAARTENERLTAAYVDAYNRSHDQYVRKHEDIVTNQNAALKKLHTTANETLKGIRDQSADKLDAYSTRQRDPFYKMMTVDARFRDEGDHYVLRAQIPQHERDHVSVAVKGNQIVLSGYRRNEERLQLEPGRTQGSSAYQSFQETFPITWPVESRQMTRDFEGDELVVRIPKKNEFAPVTPPKKTAARSVAPRPQFPDNIPYTKPAGRAPASNRGDAMEPLEPIRADLKSPGSLVLNVDENAKLK